MACMNLCGIPSWSQVGMEFPQVGIRDTSVHGACIDATFWALHQWPNVTFALVVVLMIILFISLRIIKRNQNQLQYTAGMQSMFQQGFRLQEVIEQKLTALDTRLTNLEDFLYGLWRLSRGGRSTGSESD
ncbi:hypothetical protein J4Q44_G00059010 [Coregonus suidteri]|uniref:Uncharacterized protein n=1 Tax=Coregonus suidteri TaxID=861788 RepID=A0AAN8MBS1_9TELE